MSLENYPLLKKHQSLQERFNEVSRLITEPDLLSDMQRYIKLNQEYKQLSSLIKAFNDYKQTVQNIEAGKEILAETNDQELIDLSTKDIQEGQVLLADQEQAIKMLLAPADPEDFKNAIIEIRAGTGGDEASIFAGDLFRMYSRYCEQKGWKMEVTRYSEGTSGGYKEVIANIQCNDGGVYGILKYESGVHRVQRVPQTETQGRIHTSAASVVVLPEAEEFDIELKESDIRRDTFCSSGPGGQSVNTTYSAIRLTHMPTGIVVSCQDEKSQQKNLAKAMTELRTRIYNIELQKRMDSVASKRKTMVSTGDRSAKIRTYNWPQGRITDHRINLTIYNLPAVMNGDINELLEKLHIEETIERLKEAELY